MATREVIVELRLGDAGAVARLGQLEIETKKYQRELRLLNAEIAKNGAATKAQELAVGQLNARIRANQSVVRELKNDLSGATAAGLRFRDKMAEASRAGLGAFGIQALSVAGAVTTAVTVIKDAIGTITDFDKALSGIRALGGDYATSINDIAEATKTAGIEFGFTAIQSAEAVEALAKAGISVEQILGGGLQGALTLAAAGELSVADAAEVSSKAMTQFGLAGSDVTRIADLLANGANKATGDVSDFAMALNQSGQVAAQFGIPIEEAVASLTAFASAGLLGSDAGTSFRTMLIRLAKPSEDAAKLMESLGINAYDAQGAFVGVENLAGQLQSQLSGLTEEQRNNALATIFGNDAIRAATVLYKEGAAGIANWTNEVSQSGEAARIAAERTNNLSGDIGKLKSSYDAVILGAGSFNDAIRSSVQWLTRLIETSSGAADSTLTLARRQALAVETMTAGIVSADKFQDAISALTFGLYEDSGETFRNAQAKKDLAKETEKAGDATKKAVAPLMEQVMAQEESANTVKALRDRLKDLKEQRDSLDTSDKDGLATNAAAIIAIEKQIKAIDAQTESTKKAKKAWEELTQAQKDAIISANQISEDVNQNLFAIDEEAAIKTALDIQEKIKKALKENSVEDFRAAFDLDEDVTFEPDVDAAVDAYRRDAEAFVLAQQEKIDSLRAVSDALVAFGDLAGQESVAGKALATVAALVNTYLGATLALTDKAIPSAFARIAAAAAVIATGLASVRKIQGFKEGGFTSKRASDREEVGAVHANEWVAPAWQTRHPVYGPQIKALEAARKRRGLDMGLSGFASGGPTGSNYTFTKATGLAPQTGSGTIAQADLSRAIMNMPAPVVSISEFRDVERRVNIIERMSR